VRRYRQLKSAISSTGLSMNMEVNLSTMSVLQASTACIDHAVLTSFNSQLREPLPMLWF
jgi:hypothetical protein